MLRLIITSAVDFSHIRSYVLFKNISDNIANGLNVQWYGSYKKYFIKI
ncbi:hypothetical protein ACQPU1_07055 [Clostridium paraputrificum]